MSCNHSKALELAESGQLDASHRIVQACSDTLACRIHGYLHRIEGDMGNAAYWYRRAGMDMPQNSLQEEHQCLYELVK